MNTSIRHSLKVMLLASGLAAAATVSAQTADTGIGGTAPALQLFESVDQPASAASGSGPRFALVGTSRFGDRYRVRLEANGGEVLAVDVRRGETVAVPGHPGFSIEVSGARQVIVQHPGSTPCQADEDRGVVCQAGGMQSRLQLATAAPLAPRETPAETTDNDNAEPESGEAEPDNPFARALRAARERNGEDEAAARARAQRFQQRRRIDPDNVPEGFRVVRTPFGDRLIED